MYFKHTSEIIRYNHKPPSVVHTQTQEKGLLWHDTLGHLALRGSYLQWFKITVQSPNAVNVTALNYFICAACESKYRHKRKHTHQYIYYYNRLDEGHEKGHFIVFLKNISVIHMCDVRQLFSFYSHV